MKRGAFLLVSGLAASCARNVELPNRDPATQVLAAAVPRTGGLRLWLFTKGPPCRLERVDPAARGAVEASVEMPDCRGDSPHVSFSPDGNGAAIASNGCAPGVDATSCWWAVNFREGGATHLSVPHDSPLAGDRVGEGFIDGGAFVMHRKWAPERGWFARLLRRAGLGDGCSRPGREALYVPGAPAHTLLESAAESACGADDAVLPQYTIAEFRLAMRLPDAEEEIVRGVPARALVLDDDGGSVAFSDTSLVFLDVDGSVVRTITGVRVAGAEVFRGHVLTHAPSRRELSVYTIRGEHLWTGTADNGGFWPPFE